MRKRALFMVFIVLLGQSALVLQSGTGRSNSKYIDDYLGKDTYDLQSQIDSTPEGGTLLLPEGEMEGIYYANQSINIIGQGNETTILSSKYNSIMIQSSGVNISDIGFRSGSSCIYLRGNYYNIGIYGCNFSNCYRGISIYNPYSHCEDIIIRNNSFFNAINDGIYLQGVRYCEIDHNFFYHVGDGIYGNDMEYSNISMNIFENGEVGINLRNSDVIVANSNTVKELETGIGVSYTTGTNISKNRVFDSRVGIKIERSSSIVTERNHLEDLEKGIYLFYSDDNRIHNNTIKRSTGNGIEVYFSRYNSIENCSVSDCATIFEGLVIAGIYVGYASYYNTVKDNEMTGCGMSIYPFLSTWEGQEVFDNTVNGRDLVFIKYESDILIDEKTGQVLLYKCSNVTISGQDLSNATFGILAVDCDEIHVDECRLDDNHYGIDFLSDENYDMVSDISIINCSIKRTLFSILLDSNYWIRDVKIAFNTISEGMTALNMNAYYSSSSSSTGIDISNNTISGFEYYGITLDGLREVDIVGNHIENCNNSLKVIGNYYDDNYRNDISHNIVERGERGFNLSSINDLTLKGNIIRNTTDFGMSFSAMKDTEVSGNSIIPSGGTGIIFSGYSSDNQAVKDNIIQNARTYGILMRGATAVEFKDNQLENCGFFIEPNGGGNWNNIDLDDSNKVNGRPVLFAAHKISISVPEDPGQVIVKECDTVFLKDLSIENTTVAVQLVNCDYYKIDNCTFDDNYFGVHIHAIQDDWRGGKITRTTVNRCRYDGISVTQSELLVENCKILDCGYPYYENGRSGIYSVHEDLYLRETDFIRCGVFFDLGSIEDIGDDLVSENTTVNGKDLIVMVSKDEIVIEQLAGQIYLINCFDVKIMDQDLSRSTIGIYSISSWKISIENVSTNQCLNGIHLICYESQPTGFDMENSTFNNCRYEGVKIKAGDPYFVDNIRFFGIECSGNGGNGITINRVRNGFSMENSTLSGNGKTGLDLIQFQGWEYDIRIANCTLSENGMNGATLTINSRSFIYGNSLRNNGKYGMKIRDSNNIFEIMRNDMSSNGMSGLIMDDHFSNFVIDNNTFSSNGMFGMEVKGSTHLITYNDIIGNGEDGVWMQSSRTEVRWNNISMNGNNGLEIIGNQNIVHNNSIMLNTEYGIVLWENTNKNLFVFNYLIYNYGPLGQVLDPNNANLWDNGMHGNFWSDHQSPDTDSDGIVGLPNILPGPNVLDEYPQVMINHDPLFLTDPATEAMSHVVYFQEFMVFDRNPIDRIEVEILIGPDFLSWDDMRSALVGTPLTEHIGKHTINISARDGKGGVAYLEYMLNVANNPVRLKGNPIPDLYEGDELIHIVPYINLDNDDLHWTIETTASFVQIGESDGILRGIPDDPDIGKHWIEILVDDGRGAADTVNYSFEVFNINDRPRILTEDVTKAYEDRLYWIEYEYLDPDPDGNQQEWYMKTDAEFLKCNKLTGSVHGTPTEDDIGTYTVNISVEDIHNEKDYHEFMLEVLNVNDAPVITSDQPLDTVKQGEGYRFEFRATDSDPTKDILTWSVETNATFLSMDNDTGLLRGTPGNEDVGEWIVTVMVSDPSGANDTLSFIIWVDDVNDKPLFTIHELPDAIEDVFYSVMINAYDPDHPPDPIEFAIDKVWTFLSIDPITGELQGIPNQNDVGEISFNITITDEEGASTTRQFNLTVINVNDAPEPKHPELQISLDEDSVDFEILLRNIFTDVDGDNLSFLMDNDDPHIDIMILDNGIMLVNPQEDWNGIVRFNLSTTDGELSASMILILKITPKNDAPRDLEVTYKESYGYNEKQACSANGYDPDIIYGDRLFFSWYDEDQVRIATGRDVVLDLSPGIHTITVKAADNDGLETSLVIEITIEDEDSSTRILVIAAIALLLMAFAGSGIFLFVLLRRRTQTKEKKREEDFFLPKQPPTRLQSTPPQTISTVVKADPIKEVSAPTEQKPIKPSPVVTTFEEQTNEVQEPHVINEINITDP